ncbi:uncharacterized protein LAJ45_02065 [Morchella importuna]|uniref:Chitin-binding type-4 domain-containing protein n=1 Tax=Morchella conica CCBAS932 TaxID=1392247 RepID=A0A3N4L694_9PEZI|nr:uncharacterized protein LAJ45_02065 [Morchella importuna]KAH8154297.1 hypothetical protein LAJ45_02065 [Morchella importuna]RPB17022.1 hypothetical protein P167DRAFT_480256 [Morchella conica CCBAS932]
MFSKALILALIPTAFGHMGLFHPSAYDFNGDGYTLVEPLSGQSFNSWWFHGNIGKSTGEVMELPAGGSVSLELSCNKQFTSYGNAGDGSTACPDDIPSYHAGTPIKNSEILGCGLAIAYKDSAASVNPSDFTIFSVNTDCVDNLHTSFDVPAGMPECPNGKCICAWFWQGQASADEMYMTGFDCTITGSTSTKSVGAGQPPKYCPNGGCVSGPKQPMYWANDNSNVNYDGVYTHKPSYNSAWGFSNGAQNDIFEGSSSSPTSVASSPTSRAGSPSPTTLVTSTRKSQPTGGATCSWPGHCAGASCSDENDCSDSLTCQSGKCA